MLKALPRRQISPKPTKSLATCNYDASDLDLNKQAMFSPCPFRLGTGSTENVAYGSMLARKSGTSGNYRAKKKGVKLTRRPHRLELKLSDAEREIVVNGAKANGLTLAAYLRQAAMIEQPANTRTRAHIVDRAAVAALNAIGSNLNQIARVGNASGTFSAKNLAVLAETHRALLAIVRKVQHPEIPNDWKA